MKLSLFGYTIIIQKNALNDEKLPADLKLALEIIKKYGYTPPPSQKKRDAAAAATKIRQARAKEKIQNAINLLKLEGKEVTAYAVAKVAGVSYNTAKKYLQNANML